MKGSLFRSAFITFSDVQMAEAAIREMNGALIDGVSINVSFARRQNQESRPQPRWQQQRFVSAEQPPFNPATIDDLSRKRKLSNTEIDVEPERKLVTYEDGELFNKSDSD